MSHQPNEPTRLSRRAIAAIGVVAGLIGAAAGLAVTTGGGGPTPLRLASSEGTVTTSPDLAPGEQATFPAGEAGTVRIERTDAGLRVVSADTAAGWASEIEKAAGREVEVVFSTADRRIDFEAELDDGVIKVRVRERTLVPPTTAAPTTAPSTTEPPTTAPSTSEPPTTAPSTAPSTTAPPVPTTGAPDVRTISAGEAGSITVAIVGGRLELRSVDPAAGWTPSVEKNDGHEVEVTFWRDGTKVEVEVELEHGDLKVKVKTESDGHSGSSVDDHHDDDHHDGSGHDGSGDDDGHHHDD